MAYNKIGKILAALGMGLGGAGQIYGAFQKQRQAQQQAEQEQAQTQAFRKAFSIGEDTLPASTPYPKVKDFITQLREREKSLAALKALPYKEQERKLRVQALQKKLNRPPSLSEIIEDEIRDQYLQQQGLPFKIK
jgi:hypothetical protein